MACGDLVIKDLDFMVETLKSDRKFIAIDMESYAFLHAVNAFIKKPHALIIKLVTDFADESKDDSVRAFCVGMIGAIYKKILIQKIK